jgi:hypothetical protein
MRYPAMTDTYRLDVYVSLDAATWHKMPVLLNVDTGMMSDPIDPTLGPKLPAEFLPSQPIPEIDDPHPEPDASIIEVALPFS